MRRDDEIRFGDNDKNHFEFIHKCNGDTFVMRVHSEQSLTDMLEHFKHFLLGAGFSFDTCSTIELVEPEET